jgi:hypothetical protein
MEYPVIFAVDFDGTLCENCWPEIGKPNLKLIDFLKGTRKLGNKVILWTNRDGEDLQAAVDWCKEKGLEFDAINDNTKESQEFFGNNSRKIFANFYIDDKNVSPDMWDLPYKFREPINYKPNKQLKVERKEE